MVITEMLAKLGVSQLSEMQANAIATIRNNKNVVLLSPTGTGKTLAFLLPLLEKLNPQEELPQAVILSPTRELTKQTHSVLVKMNPPYRVSCVYGGRPAMEEHRQMSGLRPQIVLGTPGRVLDHIEKANFAVNKVKVLVIDEFDKMLELKFQAELSAIIERLPFVNSNILVSATNSDEIRQFEPFVKNPPAILNYLGGSKESLPSSIRHYIVHSPVKDKLETLCYLLRSLRGESAVVFLNYREAVERVGAYLKEQGFVCSIFHGGLEQDRRERALFLFMGGATNVLVSTDLSARGLDIRSLRHIVHYHLPVHSEDYLHRCGRTGRWDDDGDSFLLLGPEETMQQYANISFEEFTLEASVPAPQLPLWQTIYIGRGKRDKISRGDVVGFLCKQGGAKADDIGRIDVRERYTYVSVRRNRCKQIMSQCANEKIKKQKTCIEIIK